MALQLHCLGVGAKVTCLTRFLHPFEHIRAKYPNPVSGHRLEGCVVVHQELKKVTRKDQLCVIVHHDNFKTTEDVFIELHAVKCYFKVTEEGDQDLFFNAVVEGGEEQAVPQIRLPEVMDEALNGQSTDNNTSEALKRHFKVDDDNEPAPENVRQPTDPRERVLQTEWGQNGLYYRKLNNIGDHHAHLNFLADPTSSQYYVQLFEGLFSKQLLQVIIKKVNENLEGDSLTYGEFLRWIGIWILMSTVDGADQRAFWSTKNVDPFHGAPFHVTPFMSQCRFENILTNLGYTEEAPPTYRDCFWEVRRMLDIWNKNMGTNFSLSWINCIDESMSKWDNEFSCPGFMFVPQKPWLFGNEYHDAGCADSDIIWSLDLREGKYHPTTLGKKEFDELGMIDNHNSFQMHPISMEDTWIL